MNKVSRKELFKLLKNKGNQTFKELSTKSGYHEKYLIKLYPLVKSDKISYISKSKGKISPKKVNDDLCNNIKILYQSKKWNSKKELYDYMNKNNIFTPSYSVVCKILRKQTFYHKLCVMTKYIINNEIVFVAFDYHTLKKLVIINNVTNNKVAFHQLFKAVIIKFGAPNDIACNNLFPHNHNYIDRYIKKFNIKKIDNNYDIRKAIRKVRKNLLDEKRSVIKYRDCKYEDKDFYYRRIVKLNKDLSFQYNNTRYKTLDNNFKNDKLTYAYYNELKEIQLVEQNNLTSRVIKIKSVISKKGLTKY